MTFYDMTWLERVLFLKRIKGGGSSGHEETTASNSFITDMVAPLRKLLLTLNPKQSGSGDPSPDNVRPISGWDGVSVTRCGSNLLDTSTSTSNLKLNKDGTTSSASNSLVSDYIKVSPSTSYYFIDVKGSNSGVALCEYDANKSFTAYQTFYGSGKKSGAKTVSASTQYIRVSYYEDSTNIAVNCPSTDTEYHAYAGQTYSASWQTEAGTVYGGTLDMVSGVLTVTDGYIASYSGETLPSTWISDRDVYASGTTPTSGAEVVYKLATPQTYQLTPQQINTLIGTNVIMTDANVEEIIYLKKAE